MSIQLEEEDEVGEEGKEEEPTVGGSLPFQGSADYKRLVASLKRAAIPPGEGTCYVEY